MKRIPEPDLQILLSIIYHLIDTPMLYGIRFTARKLVTYLLLTTFLLSLAGLVATYLLWVKQYTMALGFIPLFNMDAEYNIPSLFSVALIGG
ncbi:MAG TPA: hypothetical protein VGE06_12315, partial [Flavisolibacter sp.]